MVDGEDENEDDEPEDPHHGMIPRALQIMQEDRWHHHNHQNHHSRERKSTQAGAQSSSIATITDRPPHSGQGEADNLAEVEFQLQKSYFSKYGTRDWPG